MGLGRLMLSNELRLTRQRLGTERKVPSGEETGGGRGFEGAASAGPGWRAHWREELEGEGILPPDLLIFFWELAREEGGERSLFGDGSAFGSP